MKHQEGTLSGTAGAELFTQSWQPDGEPRAVLAIVHGIGEHSGRYPNVVDTLVARGLAVYGYDHRGHGRSTGQRGHITRWSEFRQDLGLFLARVRQEQAGRPLFLMGHSLGGLIVLEYVLHDPNGLRAVVASAPAVAQTGASPLLVALSRIMSRLAPTFSLDTGLDASAISRDPAAVRAYTNDPLVHGKATARFGAEFVEAMAWVNAHAVEFQPPLLVIQGTADRLVPAAAVRAFFERVPVADKEFHEYEGYYHECHNDVDWEKPVGELADWLEQHL